MSDTTNQPTHWYHSVITTNEALEYRLPADDELWTAADRRNWAKLERLAELRGTHIDRTGYPRL